MPKCLLVALVLSTPVTVRAQGGRLAVIPTHIEGTAKSQVPELFDDYLLTAVHGTGGFEVIGQDDINALIGFEKQKELFGCDDVACMADIGGALGVERLHSAKIARLKDDWVITLKLINIKQAKVESRSSEFVRGDAKALLDAVPDIVRRLFAGGGMTHPEAVSAPAPAPAASTPPVALAAPARAASPVPAAARDPALARSKRATGTGLAIAGLAATAAGTLLAVSKGGKMVAEGKEAWREDGYVGVNVRGACNEYRASDWDSQRTAAPIDGVLSDDQCEVANMGMLALAAAVYGGGLLFTGLGAQKYIDGKAIAQTGDASAEGHYPYMWLGYTLAVVGMASPLLGGAMQSDALAYAGGLGGVIGSAVFFALSMGSDSTYYTAGGSSGTPTAGLLLAPSGGRLVPFVTLAMPL